MATPNGLRLAVFSDGAVKTADAVMCVQNEVCGYTNIR
jgi:hypothetical protein